jgi:hypothetical protein
MQVSLPQVLITTYEKALKFIKEISKDIWLKVHLAPEPSSASLGLTDYSQADMLGLRHKSVNFGVARSFGSSPNW